jgi:hypothetical protein
MARIATPKAGDRIENFFSVMGPAMYAFRTNDQARMLLEEPVARERHPVGLKIR